LLQRCPSPPAHDPHQTISLCSVLHRLRQVVHFDVDIVHQSRQLGHVVGLALPGLEGSILSDCVTVELWPLFVPEPPRLVVQSNVLVPARLVFVSAVRLVELFVHGVDLVFCVTDVLLEHPDVLQQAVAVGVPPPLWCVAAGAWVEGHF